MESSDASEQTIQVPGEESNPTLSEERWTEIHFNWGGKPYKVDVADSDRLFDLKTAIYNLTKVPSERQKILGFVKGKLPPDQTRIQPTKIDCASSELFIVPTKRFTLIGTPEGDEIKDPSQLESLPDVVNDLDVDFSENLVASNRYQHDARNIRKIYEATKNLQVNIIHPLHQGKKLLVLDIDYTILDTKPLTSGSLPPAECARPGLHEFLEAIYPFYDICIWSQTSWIWLETKLVELGMVGSQRSYQISFVLDKTCMFTVFTERDNKPWTHSVKALQIIWNHFPQFNATNTIHVDDLSRNFALNPKEGLKISAFKNAHTPEAAADRELKKLAHYMIHIAGVSDFTTLSHKNWKNTVKLLAGP
ncbi:HAD-like domain-containing protein [Gymnopilus junonius]|uniref:HAD-like domain-containing protein n=1 Tax=Gymnopilus junonius TaxID=109634 RepID=A0A9P5P0Y5_GYMJU|nr:HAD-like domain-containing protein [Gymnopilus junonius]